jgi:putative restriction endonuclease
MILAMDYQDKFCRLNAASAEAGRKRPHKPCMLLAVIELIEAKRITTNCIEYNDVLISRYRGYFEVVKQGNDRLNPWLPFFHLKGDKFWHLIPQLGKEAVLEAMSTATKRSDIEANIQYATLDDDLFQLLLDPIERDLLRERILLHWFPGKLEPIRDQIGITEFELVLQSGQANAEEQFQSPVRSSAFRRLVIEAYDFRCAATGWRLILPDYSNLVDAAHIVPFSETADDRPQNGMALTPTFHRALDKGMIAPGPDLKWHVSKLIDRVPDNEPLLALSGEKVRLPREVQYHPDKEALAWRLARMESGDVG